MGQRSIVERNKGLEYGLSSVSIVNFEHVNADPDV